MPRGQGRSYYGEVTDRLRRFLGLDGAYPVEIEEGVRPVIIAGHADDPGLNPFVGRRFASSFSAATAAGNFNFIQATTPRGLIVEQVTISTNLAGVYRLTIGNAGAFIAGAGTDQTVIMDNINALGTERAGAQVNALAAVAARVRIHEAAILINTAYTWSPPRGIYLPQWGYIGAEITAGAPTFALSVTGRIPQEL